MRHIDEGGGAARTLVLMARLGHTRSKVIHRRATEATHSTRPPTMATAIRRIMEEKRGRKGDRAASGCFRKQPWTGQGAEKKERE